MRKNYFEFPSLKDVYLEDSYITGIYEYAGRVEFSLLLVLKEAHARYKAPSASEQYCYHDAILIFDRIKSFKWSSRSGNFSVDPDGSVDYGNIHVFLIENSLFHIEGDFGSVEIDGEFPRLEYKPYELFS